MVQGMELGYESDFQLPRGIEFHAFALLEALLCV
jgi:hypothetical protein